MTYGARVIDSTPPPMNTSPSPTAIAWAAELIAWSPLPHRRLTVSPPTSTGRPASNSAIRATSRLSSPAWFAQPRMTSSISPGSMPERSTTARMTVAARSSGRTLARAPPYRPIGRPNGLDDPCLTKGSLQVTHGRIVGAGGLRGPEGVSLRVVSRPRPAVRTGPPDGRRPIAGRGRCQTRSRRRRPARDAPRRRSHRGAGPGFRRYSMPAGTSGSSRNAGATVPRRPSVYS